MASSIVLLNLWIAMCSRDPFHLNCERWHCNMVGEAWVCKLSKDEHNAPQQPLPEYEQ